MVTASTHVLSVDSVGTADLPRFRALATVCTYSLCLMVTRILMDSLPLSRRAQAGPVPFNNNQTTAATTIYIYLLLIIYLLLLRTTGDIMHFLLQILAPDPNHSLRVILTINTKPSPIPITMHNKSVSLLYTQ